MSHKNSGMPALYELMGGKKGSSGPPARRPKEQAPPPSTDESTGSWLSPGRMLKLPVGYVLVGLGIAITLMAGTYIFGFRNAKQAVRQDFEQDLLMNTGILNAPQTTDPLLETSSGGSTPFEGSGFLSGDAITQNPVVSEPSKDPDSDLGWGTLFSDPRQSGQNYFILMQTTKEGAERVVRFCRKHGLETYAVVRNNARTFKVIVLPGFESTERSSQKVKDLETLIHRIGDKWRREEGGTTDFRDKYPSLFKG
ncbi:MAG: hypothetical protein O7G85_12635 [Planctomycetota bacterium]|nr:hypothetical protein [Planctomycetota bacterium]